MPRMLNETASDGSLTVEVGGAFASDDAARIHDLIERSAPGTAVEIDFRRVRDCQAAALALLARDIARGRARVALRGTSQHQERLLGYLGVHAAPRLRDA